MPIPIRPRAATVPPGSRARPSDETATTKVLQELRVAQIGVQSCSHFSWVSRSNSISLK